MWQIPSPRCDWSWLLHCSHALNGARAAVVLVVEDLIRCDVAEYLREAGYTVVETASGEEAITMCKSDLSIDIVFTDIHLIGSANGWDVAECVRADRPNVSVLYTSGQSIDGTQPLAGVYEHRGTDEA